MRAAKSESSQGYTPFEGMELTGQVASTDLCGKLIYDKGKVLGTPGGVTSSGRTDPG